ncbi:MAG: DMT family protein [Anaerolineae bacterium]
MRTILTTISLLLVSNTFMTIAWYGHLKHNSRPLIVAIVLSWSIAFFEYVFQVPANRIGSARLSLTQLKIIQECVALSVFVVYAWVVFREPARWNTVAAMLLVVLAVALTFVGGAPGGRP